MPLIFIRSRDGATVSESEALDASRRLRDGYRHAPMREGERISFDMAFMDSIRPSARFTDAEATFRDSAEGKRAIACARQCFELANPPGRSTKVWDADREADVVRQEMIRRSGTPIRAADNPSTATARAIRDAARLNRNNG